MLVTFHTHAKVVEIMRQNACLLTFCVQNLLAYMLIKTGIDVNCSLCYKN